MISTYWLSRIKKNYERNGIIKFILNIFLFLNKILNPSNTGELPFKYFFIKKRREIRKFAKKYLDQLDDLKIKNCGNYMLTIDKINSNSKVYSFGVGTSISFEENLTKLKQCKIYCYDPTSMAENWISKQSFDREKIIFNKIGIWTEDEDVKFYSQKTDDPNISGGSISNLFESDDFTLLKCQKLKTMMNENNHSNIDLLKMDIEGVAVQVINDILNEGIYPQQIIAEFEFSENDEFDQTKFNEWSLNLQNLLSKIRSLGYKCYYLPRFTHMAFSTIEILFIKHD
jgi:FkbM family methyltransferase